jgi:hypothetical protein
MAVIDWHEKSIRPVSAGIFQRDPKLPKINVCVLKRMAVGSVGFQNVRRRAEVIRHHNITVNKGVKKLKWNVLYTPDH